MDHNAAGASQYKPHPWHGISYGPDAPEAVTTFVEVVPSDTVKYEIDKVSGYLKIDRPQKYSNICPALYGFIPRTYSGEQVAAYCSAQSGLTVVGDDDPLDICILAERVITHGNVLVSAIPIGGFRMIDGGEADDKLIAVLKNDSVYGGYKSIKDCTSGVVNRLKHYFLTYKDLPGEKRDCEITHTYDWEEAHEVINRGIADYKNHFGG